MSTMEYPGALVVTSRESIEEHRRQQQRWLLWDRSLTRAVLDAKRARIANRIRDLPHS